MGRWAATPISWGFVGRGRWGVDLAPERILAETVGLGLHAIECGVPGFLPADPAEARALLDGHGVCAVAAPVSVVLHEGDQADALAAVAALADRLQVLGASVVMTVPKRGSVADGEVLDDRRWRHLVDGLARIGDILDARGLRQALHPHVNSLVETADDMARLAATSDVGWTLDIAHVACGGMDPVAFAHELGARVAHVHVKDCDLDLGRRMVRHEVPFDEAIRAGVFVPLGAGDLDLAAIVPALPRGPWWVVEQDQAVANEPPPGEGPVRDVAASLTHLRALLTA